MAVVEVGMTQEQALAPLIAIPKAIYAAKFVRLLENDKVPEPQKYFFATQKSGTMLKPMFQLEDEKYGGKTLIGMAVMGQFSYAELIVALPNLYVPGTSKIDSEAAKGTRVLLDVVQQVKLTETGKYVPYTPELEGQYTGAVLNGIAHVLPFVEGAQTVEG